MYFPGIDVQKRNSYIAVLDDGNGVKEVRVVNANLDDIATKYVSSTAAIEATINYYAIYNTLDEYLNVVVANPYQTKAISITEVKTIDVVRSFIEAL